MRILNGSGINRGITSGIVFFHHPTPGGEPRFDLSINQKSILEAAIARSVAELEKDVEDGDRAHGDAVRMVFEAHKLMVRDPILLDDVFARIDAGESAYRAYRDGAAAVVSRFSALTNPYMRNRVIDIIDATDRVLHAMVADQYERTFRFAEPHIIVMDQMRPSVILNCHRPHVVGFIAEAGAYDQHSSMIARVKNLPGVVIPDAFRSLTDGDMVIVDGDAGIVTVVEPHS